ncbi:MAG: SGNH/GDSL hydrolase family protein [Acidobacteria bacterium]|nr:SGNH/GDSL hydrolase family protein [Acidobacteriota bacterium]MBI3427759.1 SGNH/GDSL hydrolase family protein [Acidobacteriota bacterium]
MSHVVLLGDSIFDNTAYVNGGPAVLQQLHAVLPADWRATLCAVDGSMTTNVQRQLEKLPSDADFLVVSIGGNDAIDSSDVLTLSAQSVAEALAHLASRADQFEYNYQVMLRAVLDRKLPTTLCTVYYPRFTEAAFQRVAVTALTVFNDCIIRAAFAHGLPLLDLRLICNEDADFANPIEPSVQGGAKIAAAINQVVTEHDFRQSHTRVFV